MSCASDDTLVALLQFLLTLNFNETSAINTLKREFEQQIASNRTLYQISNIKDLVRILRKRDLISTACLDQIAYKLPHNLYGKYMQIKELKSIKIVNSLEKHECVNINEPNIQQMVTNIQKVRTNHVTGACFNPSPNTLNQEESVKLQGLERAYTIICEELGPKHLKFMARHLEYRECRIDELDVRFHSTAECARQVLRWHQETCNSKSWRQNLLNALDQAKRSDIRILVERKLDEYNIVVPPVQSAR